MPLSELEEKRISFASCSDLFLREGLDHLSLNRRDSGLRIALILPKCVSENLKGSVRDLRTLAWRVPL